ncbi:unnamed protein product [Acanthosepion pharaonis]|uniref:Uncharacterized protein n=1 Tax=Acanthosepion pharaonis TaxID=158019 RepID=A0A812AXG7_ACAPH|nr:unnamed protein product [Sepia pharaonis]
MANQIAATFSSLFSEIFLFLFFFERVLFLEIIGFFCTFFLSIHSFLKDIFVHSLIYLIFLFHHFSYTFSSLVPIFFPSYSCSVYIPCISLSVIAALYNFFLSSYLRIFNFSHVFFFVLSFFFFFHYFIRSFFLSSFLSYICLSFLLLFFLISFSITLFFPPFILSPFLSFFLSSSLSYSFLSCFFLSFFLLPFSFSFFLLPFLIHFSCFFLSLFFFPKTNNYNDTEYFPTPTTKYLYFSFIPYVLTNPHLLQPTHNIPSFLHFFFLRRYVLFVIFQKDIYLIYPKFFPLFGTVFVRRRFIHLHVPFLIFFVVLPPSSPHFRSPFKKTVFAVISRLKSEGKQA